MLLAAYNTIQFCVITKDAKVLPLLTAVTQLKALEIGSQVKKKIYVAYQKCSTCHYLSTYISFSIALSRSVSPL